MDTKIFRFYEAFKSHEFTEEQLNDVVEGMKTIIKDESRENATKKDIDDIKKEIGDLKTLIYEKYTSIVIWVVSTGIAITGLIIAVTKLL